MKSQTLFLTLVAFTCLTSASMAKDASNTADAIDYKILVKSATELDAVAGTVTLPLYKGSFAGQPVWYVVTESSDETDALSRGVNWSPKLANTLGTPAVQTVTDLDGEAVFSGTVDFTPEPVLVPGPTIFPPTQASPGSTGDAAYSPLLTFGDGVVLNAPHVANATGIHDKVVAIDFTRQTVTVALTAGFYHGRSILYLSTDASDPVAATLESATFAPNMNAAPGLASNGADSARSSIVPIVNGETAPSPNRQGFISAILGEGSPLNVTIIHPRNRGKIPTYSPLWDVHPAVWTDEAIDSGLRTLLTHHAKIAKAVERGLLVSGGMGPANPDLGGLRAAGFIVNCPIIAIE